MRAPTMTGAMRAAVSPMFVAMPIMVGFVPRLTVDGLVISPVMTFSFRDRSISGVSALVRR